MSKIFVTLGPSSLNSDVIKECDKQGVDLFRINLSHTPYDEISQVIKKIREHTKTPICLDSEGAQMRNQKMSSDEIYFTEGDEVIIHFDETVGDSNNISFSPVGIARQFQIGDVIKIDFHQATLIVKSITSSHIVSLVTKSGWVGSNKASDIQNRLLIFEPLSNKDLYAINIGKEWNIDYFALSFTNCAKDVKQLKQLWDKNIICKIESRLALWNLEEIIVEADQILIDRGDLSRQVEIEQIPFYQRTIIDTAKEYNTPVHVATNLLETMVRSETPSRAEVNDVISTLEMGANGLVLAAETAIGSYPVQSVQMIRKLINEWNRREKYERNNPSITEKV